MIFLTSNIHQPLKFVEIGGWIETHQLIFLLLAGLGDYVQLIYHLLMQAVEQSMFSQQEISGTGIDMILIFCTSIRIMMILDVFYGFTLVIAFNW